MRIISFILIALSFLAFSKNNPAIDSYSQYPIEELVAIGIRPGPELWKVTKGENVLWILGTLSPLPKKMVWHTELVEAVIEDSQVLLLPPVVTADIGFFQGLSLATSAIGIKKNPKKLKLKDVIPAELHARWLVLKKKYMGKDRGIEKTRPIFAAQKLFQKAIKKIGLKSETGIRKKVRKIAKKNKLEIITPTITLDLNKPKSAIKKFKKTQISDLECFTKTLDRIETDLKIMHSRAFAWANGNITKIKHLPYEDESRACIKALLNSSIAQNAGVNNIPSRARTVWVEEAIKSLAENKSTFAMLSIGNLLGDNSYLNDLTAQGYVVKVPK